jgi:hypothetical protein
VVRRDLGHTAVDPRPDTIHRGNHRTTPDSEVMAQGYRFSRTLIAKKERSLVTVLLVGIGVPWAVAGVMLWAGQLLWVEPPAVYASLLIAMIAAPLVTVVVVVTVAAILGGRSLSRHGWALGLVFSLWFFAGLALTLGQVISWVLYAAGFAVIIGIFSFLGWCRGVPMWIGGTAALPKLKRFRRTVSDGEAPSDVVDDLDRPLGWLPRAHRLAAQVRAGADPSTLSAQVHAQDPAERYAIASTVPYLVWRRLARDLVKQHPDEFRRGPDGEFTPLYLTRRSATRTGAARRL